LSFILHEKHNNKIDWVDIDLKEKNMLYYALVFLIVAILAGFFGFFGLAGLSATIAKILFLIFLVAFIISLVTGRRASV
jgi:uncharacterized membrane protein YtjA (UPF0391 family)